MTPGLDVRDTHGSGRRRAAALIAVAALVAACGGSATAAPASPSAAPSSSAAPSIGASPVAASPSPVPSPSPSPVDAGPAFLRVIADPTLAGTLTLSGTMSVAGVSLNVDGTSTFHGLDESSTLRLLQGTTVQQVNDDVTLGTKRWKRASPGPWLVDTTPPTTGMFQWLRSLTSVTDTGPELRKGTTVHHLVPPGDDRFPIEAFGALPSATNATADAQIYARADGTPAAIDVKASWTQPVNGTPSPVAIDFAVDFATVGGTVSAIEPPTPVWDVFTSARFGYSMAHPADWVVTTAKTGDKFGPTGQDVMFVSPQAATTKQDLAAFRDTLIAGYQTSLGAKPEQDVTATVGGEPSQILLYHFKNKSGTALYLVDAVMIHAGRGWEVFLVDAAGSEAQDNTAFNAFVATFAFTK